MTAVDRALTPVLMLALWTPGARPQEPSPKPILLEGTWVHQGVRDILGSGTDTSIAIRKNGEQWSITYEVTHYPSVNDKGAEPKVERLGPYRVAVEDQELVVEKEPGKATARHTFLCDDRRLILPAIVQKKPGEWSYRSEHDSFSVRCAEDPFKVPVGTAQIPGVLQGKGFYSFEEAPQSRFSPSAQYLRFLERSDEKGQLCERFR
ncbi:MAG TPA: hypothetical protein VKF62_04650, partial [Planctomycetota bacterium]|nr:hypothetical protein [Planctomycetota bacterium]